MTGKSAPKHKRRRVVIGGQILTRARAEALVDAGEKLMIAAQVIAPPFAAPAEYLVSERPDAPKRRPAAETEARRVLAYVAHCQLGVSKKLICQAMQIEWSQLNRAIKDTEDLRDDADYDARLAKIEQDVSEAWAARGAS